jgi:predicted AAA+ superfamily ATPase
MYIERSIEKELIKWKNAESQKPILLRGARQVGKTQVVRHFSQQFEHFLEINFESDKKIHSLFDGNFHTSEIIENLSAIYNIPVISKKTLLFFDEIQTCIPAIQSLRFFYEQIPDLHIIAAGSLLEFAIAEIPSFGVGRIRSMYMYPLSFQEFLA